MKRFAVFCLLFSFHALAQKRDTVLKYLDADLNFTTRKNAVYTGAAIKQENGWLFYALYPDRSFLVKAYYLDKALTQREGPYEMFYPKEHLAVSGFFHANARTGVWRTWYENQQPMDSGFLYYGTRMGIWKSWFATGQLKEESTFKEDTLLQPLRLQQANAMAAAQIIGIKHGAYRSWYPNGRLETEGTFSNDSMEGVWNWYHENGTRSTIETYKNGVITALTCFDTLGNDAGDMCSIAKPALLRQFGDYKMYIQQNLLWPKEALKNNISGAVKVTFRVTKEGRLDQLVVETGEPVLKNAVEQFFATMTDWLPAISHNRVIESDEEITIPFYQD